MKKRRRFIFSLLSELCFGIGAVLVVIAIAIAGHIPLAVGVLGGELMAGGLMGARSLLGESEVREP